MFFVLLSIAVFIFFAWVSWIEEKNILKGVGLGLIFVCVMFLFGAMFSENYHEEAQLVSEIELIQLNNDEESPIYVMKTDRWEYSYKPIGNKNNEEKEMTESDNIYLEIVQSDNCKKPVLKGYSRKTKWGFFSIGGLSRTEYVFYVPTGTYQGLYDLE